VHGALQPPSRPPREEDQRRYVDDRRDTPRAPHYPPLKENSDVHRPPSAHTKDVQPIASPSASFQHRFETQSRELSDLQHEHRAARKELKEVSDAYVVLREKYEERSRNLSDMRQERRVAREQSIEAGDAYAALRQQYEEQTKKLNYVREAAREQRQKAEEDYTTLRQKYEVRKNEYHALSNKYNSLKATLDQRTSELQGVQRFLTTADTYSGSEVVNTLQKLNEEVQQSTTFMTEWAIENFAIETPRMDKAATQSIERTRASETLGLKFMQLLGTKKHKDNPIFVEMAFRAYLIYELYWVASQWSIGEEEQSHKVYVDGIYQRIREASEAHLMQREPCMTLLTEGQAVSGNWRALTRAHTLPACMSDPENTIDMAITSSFSDMLLAAGCTGSKSDITAALWSKFGEKFHHFVSLAAQVNKMIGVGVISEDLEVLVRWPDDGFDERTMEDSYDNGDRMQGTEEREIVLCATELGLGRRAGMGEQGIVIKPKVALVSVIDIIGD
jgi:hypothetical protein